MDQINSCVTIHMVSSIDGYIANQDNTIDWFEASCDYPRGIEFEDPETFLKSIDCYVMGAKTYEYALELSKDHGWAYGTTPTVVLSKRKFESSRSHIQFYSGEIETLVNDVLKPQYKNIWVVGGSTLVQSILNKRLADKIIISILPIVLGNGLPFFKPLNQKHSLQLSDSKAYKNGMVELTYNIIHQ